MEVQRDFEDLFALLNAHKVDYIIIGAYALAYHGAPRYTGDIDILVRPDEKNAGRILDALKEFGFDSLGLSPDDFSIPGQVVQLGTAPVRVDIVTSITGVPWEEAYKGRAEGPYGKIKVYYLGKDQFISNKRALGRKKDMADLEALGVLE
ncbi:MAG: hypothetical protein ACE14T_03290 [Syntrophales bacterium]